MAFMNRHYATLHDTTKGQLHKVKNFYSTDGKLLFYFSDPPHSINPLTPKSHYSGFVIKFIIKIITHACLVLLTWNKDHSIVHEIAFKSI